MYHYSPLYSYHSAYPSISCFCWCSALGKQARASKSTKKICISNDALGCLLVAANSPVVELDYLQGDLGMVGW